jgi:DNA-binding beta-propeller fold protein YncE
MTMRSLLSARLKLSLATAFTASLAFAPLACAGNDASGNAPAPDESDESAYKSDGGSDAGPGSQLGNGTAFKLTTVFQDQYQRQPIDLDFNPMSPKEIWVVNYADDSVTIISGATAKNVLDPAAGHFMHRPPALSFGAGQTWASCGDGDNGNGFMGPSLFSSDPAIFGKATPNGLGSHLDMLHLTSFCRGIAHESANIYWAFNAELHAIDRYDFHKDHGPGNDDHSDGTAYRYGAGLVSGLDGAPSHLAYDAAEKMLYIADTGHGRVISLDTTSGTLKAPLRTMEPMAEAAVMKDEKFYMVVPPGTVKAPSGLALAKDALFVSDASSGKIYAFSRTGQPIRTLDTGLPAGSVAGLRVGPDGRIYFADRRGARIVRIDPAK